MLIVNKKWIDNYFKDKHWIRNIYAKYNLSFYVWNCYNFLETPMFNVSNIRRQYLFLNIKLVISKLIKFHDKTISLGSTKRIKFFLFRINYLSLFSNKFLYTFLHCFFFSKDWFTTKRLFKFKKKSTRRFFFLKHKARYRLTKALNKKNRKLNKGILSVTFSKRNMFLNLATNKHKSLLVTTLRRLGFLGRRRKEYLSIFSAVNVVKQTLRKYRIKCLSIIYNGWNRFRVAVKNCLKYRDRFKVPTLFIKFNLKIPHNGCRLKKKISKKRKKKVWLKRKRR